MLSSDSVVPLRDSSDTPPYSKAKETVSAKISELNESRSELQTRIQSLKQDFARLEIKARHPGEDLPRFDELEDGACSWMLVMSLELSELKKSLNVEVEQLRSEFQEQQEDVEDSLRNIGVSFLQDVSVEVNIAKAVKIEEVADEAPKAVMDHLVPSMM